MAVKMEPEQVTKYFFQSLMHNQCHVCWSLFSKKTQDEFLKWTIQDIYQRHSEAAKAATIGVPEVRLLFENNDASLMKSFWKRFFFSSNANDFFRYGYPRTREKKGRHATVEYVFQYPDGRTAKADVEMVHERNGWKIAYVESKLPF